MEEYTSMESFNYDLPKPEKLVKKTIRRILSFEEFDGLFNSDTETEYRVTKKCTCQPKIHVGDWGGIL